MPKWFGLGNKASEQVAPQQLGERAQQVRAHAQLLEAEVVAPLTQAEAAHGAQWHGAARERYAALHRRLVASLQHTQRQVEGMGGALAQSAGGYTQLTHATFGASAAADEAAPIETEYVAGRPLTPQEVRETLGKQGIAPRALSTADQRNVQDAERFRNSALKAGAPGMSDKCWAVDETTDPPLSSENIPSGYKPDRPWPQKTPDVKAYANAKLGQYGYTLPTNKTLDDYIGADGNSVGEPGYFAASHAEKQASMRGDCGYGQSKRIGVNLPQCRDCRRYFQAMAQERGAAQYVADPFITRIYYPDGSVGIVLQQNGQYEEYLMNAQQAQYGLYQASFPKNRLP